ncbi:MAG TPA: hypothetical protein PLW65_17650 [Pseudomonadota bacterium]|nr:hypothetical protein [Pseudomonadota bacterium]
MNTFSRHALHLGVLAAGLLSACGTGEGLPGIVPTMNISSPANNSTANLSANKQIAVNFTTNYTLQAPGTCGATANCGHVYLLVDNTACNSGSLAYNTLVIASPAQADLGKCATATGMHTITLQLRHDDGSPVLNLVNNPVVDTVTITAQ